jgi:hypothetical protein
MVIAKSLNLTPLFESKKVLTVDRPAVLHTQDARFQANKDIPVICVQRKNLFNEVISAVIAEHYQEWNTYTTVGDPFVADLNVLEQKYIWHKWWHKAFNHYTIYTNKTYITFEDFIGNSQQLCNILSIPEINYQSQPALRKPHECILNFDQLIETFNLYENNLQFQNSDIKTYDWFDLKKI